jgi:hypothetical protein
MTEQTRKAISNCLIKHGYDPELVKQLNEKGLYTAHTLLFAGESQKKLAITIEENK